MPHAQSLVASCMASARYLPKEVGMAVTWIVAPSWHRVVTTCREMELNPRYVVALYDKTAIYRMAGRQFNEGDVLVIDGWPHDCEASLRSKLILCRVPPYWLDWPDE